MEHKLVKRDTIIMDMGKLFGWSAVEVDYFDDPIEIIRVVFHNRDVTDFVTYEGLTNLKWLIGGVSDAGHFDVHGD